MISETLNLWSNGAVTLPKKWREKYSTKHFLAEEKPDGTLVITPIQTNVIEYENEYDPEDGHYYSGLKFPGGMPAEELLKFVEAEIKRRKKPLVSRKKSRG